MCDKCPVCGANLDYGEVCECRGDKERAAMLEEQEREYIAQERQKRMDKECAEMARKYPAFGRIMEMVERQKAGQE